MKNFATGLVVSLALTAIGVLSMFRASPAFKISILTGSTGKSSVSNASLKSATEDKLQSSAGPPSIIGDERTEYSGSTVVNKAEMRYDLEESLQDKDKSQPERPINAPTFELSGGTLRRMRELYRRKARVGGISLLLLSGVLLLVSIGFPNVVIEVDSIVAFIGGIILLFNDASHSVQLRVVERIVDSSKDYVNSLNARVLKNSEFSYVPSGPRVNDVVIVPSSIVSSILPLTSTDGIAVSGDLRGSLSPQGRGLAELFERESSLENPDLDDLISTIPRVLSNDLELAASVLAKRESGDTLEFFLVHPLLRSFCNNQGAIVGCGICSMLATLVCHVTLRETKISSCHLDLKSDICEIKLVLGKDFKQEKV